MLIEKMPSTLTWRDPATLLTIHRSYIDLLCELLAQRISIVEKTDRELLRRVNRAVEHAGNETLSRVVAAPEVSWRLIWQPMTAACDAVTFMCQGIELEEYRVNKANAFRSGWGPLGDFQVLSDGSLRTPLAIDDMMPIDVESPYAVRADLGSGDDVNALPRDPLSAPELSAVRDRLYKAGAVIRQTSELVRDFTNHFTKVLVVQKHPMEVGFSSGTTGQYIGRSVLTNLQRSELSVAEVADSIVHEAIHALLFMQERRRKWVLEENLYDSTPRATSPWSGRHLPLRAFLQACFVWYGLLNFWLQAYVRGIEIDRSAEPGRQIQERIAAAATGFLKGSLIDHVLEFTDRISPDILNAVEEMQTRVLGAFSRSIGVRPSQASALSQNITGA